MLLHWSFEEGALVTGVNSTTRHTLLKLKRRDGFRLELQFVRAGAAVVMPSTLEIRFAIKPAGDYDAAVWCLATSFVFDATNDVWVGNPSLNTTAINTAFTTANEAATIDGMAEVSWREDTGDPWTSSQTLEIELQNDVIIGDEGTPTNAEDPTDYLTAAQSEARYLRYDAAQAHDATEQNQARENLGLPLVQQTLTDAATVLWDLEDGLNATVTLAGNRTLDVPSNPPFSGCGGVLRVVQDGTGGRTLALASGWAGAALLDLTAAAVTLLPWHYDGTTFRLLLPRRLAETQQAVTGDGTEDWALAQGWNLVLTLTANTTLNAPSGAAAGMSGILVVKQDSTGSWTFTLGSGMSAPAGNAAIAIGTAANAVTLLRWYADGSTVYVVEL